MPTEPNNPRAGVSPPSDATLHQRIGDELDALRARLVEAEARRRATIEAAHLSRDPDPVSDAETATEVPGISE